MSCCDLAAAGQVVTAKNPPFLISPSLQPRFDYPAFGFSVVLGATRDPFLLLQPLPASTSWYRGEERESKGLILLLLLLLLLLLQLLPKGGKGEEARSLRGRLRALAGGVGSPEEPPNLSWSVPCILTSTEACVLPLLKRGGGRKPRMPFSLRSA